MPVRSSLPGPDGSPLSAVDLRALTRFLEQSVDHGFRLAIVESASHARREDILAEVAAAIGPRLLGLASDELPGAETNLWTALQGPFSLQAPRCLALWGLDSGARSDWASQLNVQRDLFVRDFAVPWLLFIHPASRVPLLQAAPDFCDFAILWLRDDSEPHVAVASPDMQMQDSSLSLSSANVENPFLHQALVALAAVRFDAARDALSRFTLQPDQDVLDRIRHRLYSACLERAQGKTALAEALVRDARNMLAQQPSSAEAQGLTRLADVELGFVLLQSGRYGEAETLLRRALPLFEEALGREHPDYAALLNNLGSVLERQGKYAEAERVTRDALLIAEKVGREHPFYGASLHNLAITLAAQGRWSEAEGVLRDALSRKETALGREHPDYGRSLHALGGVLSKQGKHAEADPILRASHAALEKTLGREHPDVSTSLHNLAIALKEQGKYGEAELLLREAVALKQKIQGRDHRDYAVSLFELADTLVRQGHYTEAEPLLREALAIFDKVPGHSHRGLWRTLRVLATVAAHQGRSREGIRLLERALDLGQADLGAEHPDVAHMGNQLKQLKRRSREWRPR